MGYLPEPHTDVIMAVISEELGILGAIIVIGGLGFIVLRAFIIALQAKDPHARMLSSRNWKYDRNSNIRQFGRFDRVNSAYRGSVAVY